MKNQTNINMPELEGKEIFTIYREIADNKDGIANLLKAGQLPEEKVMPLVFKTATHHLTGLKKWESKAYDIVKSHGRDGLDWVLDFIKASRNQLWAEQYIFKEYKNLTPMIDAVLDRFNSFDAWVYPTVFQCLLKDKEKPKSQTYFVYNPKTKLIKIGKSGTPMERIRTLEAQSGVNFSILAILNADIERELHVRFKQYRKKGEWFEDADGSIRKFIDELKNDKLPALFTTEPA